MKQTIWDASYLSLFCMELHLIVRAGIPFQEGIALLMEEEQHADKKQALVYVHQQLELGEGLADAFRGARCFPHYAVEMVQIGQRTGHLEQVFYALANYYDREAQIRQSVRNIIWYPTMLLAMMSFVVLVLLIKVMPIFADIFVQLGAELSSVAQLMLEIGMWLGRYGMYLFSALVCMLLLCLALYRFDGVRQWWRHAVQSFTSGWKANQLLTSSKLADALVLTASGGLSIEEALDLAGHLTEDDAVQRTITACKKAMLLDGKTFAEAAQAEQLFAPMYCRMLAIGFRTGEIDTVLAEVARRVAEDANQALDDLLNRIEPAIVITLSLLVGVILLSVMLPLLGIMTAIG